MNLPDSLKIALLQQLSRGQGQLKTWATGAVAAAVAGFLASRADWNLSPENRELIVNTIAAAAGMAVVGVINTLVAWLTTNGAAKVQEELARVHDSIEVDGVPGPVTQAGARELASLVRDNRATDDLAAR